MEQTIWTDHPSYAVNCIKDVIAILTAIILVYFGLYYFIAIPVLYALWNFLLVKTTTYQLTTERLKTSKGILNKRIDELELYRVKDYRLEQPLLLRILSLGNIYLETSDKTTPFVVLNAVGNSEVLLDNIRKHVEERRSQRSIREIDVN